MPAVESLTTKVLLNGTAIPVYAWSCQLTSYGSVNTFHVSTSIKALQLANYDVFQQQQDNPDFRINIYTVVNGSQQLIFSGIVDAVDAMWETDVIEITGRDNSAILRDQQDPLTDIQYINSPISQVVTDIATKYGFTPKVTQTTQLAGVKYQPSSGEEYALSDRTRPLWHTLQLLAQETGYILTVTAKNELYFGPPGQGQNSWTYYWKPPPSKGDASSLRPIQTLQAVQQSRRCNNFTVIITGYDRNLAQPVQDRVVVGQGGLTYYKSFVGMDPALVQQTAQAQAVEIQRRNQNFKLSVDGNPYIDIGDKVTILEYAPGDLLGMSNRQLYVATLTHSFQMADYGSSAADGFHTHITALADIPAEGE